MGGSPKAQPFIPAPKEKDPAVQEAIRKERDLTMKRKGRQSTILTGGAGLVEPPKKTLLG